MNNINAQFYSFKSSFKQLKIKLTEIFPYTTLVNNNVYSLLLLIALNFENSLFLQHQNDFDLNLKF